jgi:hypothetical protein
MIHTLNFFHDCRKGRPVRHLDDGRVVDPGRLARGELHIEIADKLER